MSCTCLESAVGVCDGAAGVVVEVRFDVAAHHAAESSDEIVDLSWGCAAANDVSDQG